MAKKIEEVLPSTQANGSKKSGRLTKKRCPLLVVLTTILLILVVLLTIVILLLPSSIKKTEKPVAKTQTGNQEKAVTIATEAEYQQYLRTHPRPTVYKGPQPTPTTKPTATPTPKSTQTRIIVPLPNGPQIYSVSSKSSITVKELWISNLATNIGDSQEFKLTIQDPNNPVSSVSINLITDYKKVLHSLSLISGSGKDGVWDGSWKTADSHDFTYQAQITIKDQSGTVFAFMLSFR